VRGQKLFVRPIEQGDRESIREFLKSNGGRIYDVSCGLAGKLVGDLVAVVAMEIDEGAIRLEDVVVLTSHRHKNIGRYMLDEVERMASKLDRTRILVSRDATPRPFFQRTGFIEEEGPWLVRRVR